jgi:hypothetical protein
MMNMGSFMMDLPKGRGRRASWGADRPAPVSPLTDRGDAGFRLRPDKN